jgi:hypothetical protein
MWSNHGPGVCTWQILLQKSPMRMARIGEAADFERSAVLSACSGRSGGSDAPQLTLMHSTKTPALLERSCNAGGGHDRRRPGDQLCEPAEVLSDRCQRELELGTAGSAQS